MPIVNWGSTLPMADQRNIHNHIRLVAHLLNELSHDHGEELEHCHVSHSQMRSSPELIQEITFEK